MASSDGYTSNHLSFLQKATSDAKLYSFYALLRNAEALAVDYPRIGRAKTIEDNIVELAHQPTLDFPPSTIASIDQRPSGRFRAKSLFLGLTGPMGPLPTHLTEFAFFERRYSRKSPFADFLDLISARMLQFFYRAWADSQAAAQADRPEDDRFSNYLAQLSGAWDGLAKTPASGTNVQDYQHPEQLGRLHLAGHFGSRRSPANICDALELTLKSNVEIREFMPRWRDVVPADRTIIGSNGQHNALGNGAMLGQRIRVIQDTFQVTVLAKDANGLEALIPTGPKFKMTRDLLDSLSPSDTDWELQIQIEEAETRGVTLGGNGRLGWSSWLAPSALGKVHRRDTRLSRRWKPRLASSGQDFADLEEHSYG